MADPKIIINVKDETLHIYINVASMSGDNHILTALAEQELIEKTFQIVEIDLKKVAYINSMGISEIINIYRNFKDTSIGTFELHLANVNPRVNAILELIEINNIATVHLQS